MRYLPRTILVALSITLSGIMCLIVISSLWATTSFLTRVTTGTGFRDSRYPHISGDGRKIVFVSDNDFLNQGIPDNQYEIWVYDIGSRDYTRVTTSTLGRNNNTPRLNYDGSKVVFVSNTDFLNQGIPTEQDEIWLYDSATMTLTRITHGMADRDSREPDISADGRKIVFVSDADLLNQNLPYEQNEIWMYDSTALTVTRITTGTSDRDSYHPSISADGSKIAFTSNSDFFNQGSQNTEIWLYDSTTQNITPITQAPDNRGSHSPSINNDGSRIAFISSGDFLDEGIPEGFPRFWLYDSTTLTFTRVTTGAHFVGNREVSLNGDGTRMALESNLNFLGDGAGRLQIWLYDSTTMTFTQITNGEDGSVWPHISSDGRRITFFSDDDLLNQDIPDQQEEIWLADIFLELHQIYLPVALRP